MFTKLARFALGIGLASLVCGSVGCAADTEDESVDSTEDALTIAREVTRVGEEGSVQGNLTKRRGASADLWGGWDAYKGSQWLAGGSCDAPDIQNGWTRASFYCSAGADGATKIVFRYGARNVSTLTLR